MVMSMQERGSVENSVERRLAVATLVADSHFQLLQYKRAEEVPALL